MLVRSWSEWPFIIIIIISKTLKPHSPKPAPKGPWGPLQGPDIPATCAHTVLKFGCGVAYSTGNAGRHVVGGVQEAGRAQQACGASGLLTVAGDGQLQPAVGRAGPGQDAG